MRSKSPPRSSHYDALKVAHDAPVEVIRAAYRSLSQKYHPDRNAGGNESGQAMAAINLAYDVLSDPLKKEDYDARMREEALGLSKRALVRIPAKRRFSMPRLRLRGIRLTRLGGVAAAVICGGALLVYASTEQRDSWLERAWYESWRGEFRLAPAAIGQETGAELLRSSSQREPAEAYAAGLKWESALKRGSVTNGGPDAAR